MDSKKDWSGVIVQPNSYFEEDTMSECPKECGEKLKNLGKIQGGHAKTLYSDDGRGGIVKDIETLKQCSVKYVTRKGAIGTSLAVLALLSGLLIFGLTAATEEVEKRQHNTTQIKVIQTELKSIKTTVDKIHKNQQDLIKDHNKKIIDPIKLMEMIREAVKPREANADTEGSN